MGRTTLLALLVAALITPAVPAAVPAAGQAVSAPGGRWYRGNTHVHTLNSDGNRAPADVVQWYREHSYHFLVVTDHEYISEVAPLNALYGAPGRFLVIPGQEVTQQVVDPARPDAPRHGHVNGINVGRVVLPLGDRGIARGTTLAATFARNIASIRAAGGVAQVNHPNFRWSVGVDDLPAVPDSTLLEVWNAQPRINNLGGDDGAGHRALSTEALWDALLTRGRRLFAVASDDAHRFRDDEREDPEATRPGGGWVMVQADTLTPEAIASALRAGRFYATNGVLLEEYAADAREIRLRIALRGGPRDDRRYRTQFIGRGGRVLAEVPGLTARYAINPGDAYVRATVIDSDGRRAWTQPVWTGVRIPRDRR